MYSLNVMLKMPDQRKLGLALVAGKDTPISAAFLSVGHRVSAQLLRELERLATERTEPGPVVRVASLVPRQLCLAVRSVVARGALQETKVKTMRAPKVDAGHAPGWRRFRAQRADERAIVSM